MACPVGVLIVLSAAHRADAECPVAVTGGYGLAGAVLAITTHIFKAAVKTAGKAKFTGRRGIGYISAAILAYSGGHDCFLRSGFLLRWYPGRNVRIRNRMMVFNGASFGVNVS